MDRQLRATAALPLSLGLHAGLLKANVRVCWRGMKGRIADERVSLYDCFIVRLFTLSTDAEDNGYYMDESLKLAFSLVHELRTSILAS